MLIGRRATLRHAIRINLTICACTLAVVPIALFYIQVEAPYPLLEIDDFPAYFHRTSSLIFSHLTFSVFMTTLPLYIALYLSCAFFLWHSLRAADRNVENTTAGIIAVGAMLSGFTATQILSVASQNAMWPRYMLTGAWIHLPLIAFLLHRFSGRRLSMVFSAAAACCAASGLLTDRIRRRIQSHQPQLAEIGCVSGSIDGLLVGTKSLRPALVSQVRQQIASHRIGTTHHSSRSAH